jgi:hypothetical protein
MGFQLVTICSGSGQERESLPLPDGRQTTKSGRNPNANILPTRTRHYPRAQSNRRGLFSINHWYTTLNCGTWAHCHLSGNVHAVLAPRFAARRAPDSNVPRLCLPPQVPQYRNELAFDRQDWTSSEFSHLTGEEEKPANMPQPRGMGFVLQAKVDAAHAADTVTRRSRTGFLVFLNSALIYWLSKKQASVESSSFGSEFCAMTHCCEYLQGLRYKLRIAYSQGNKSVLYNTTMPDSTLKKKSQSIVYHFVREGAARDEWRIPYVNTHDNDANLLTDTHERGRAWAHIIPQRTRSGLSGLANLLAYAQCFDPITQ